MLSLIQKDSVDRIIEKHGYVAVGILSQILNVGRPVQDIQIVFDRLDNVVSRNEFEDILSECFDLGIFAVDIAEEHGVLTSALMQSAAVFSGVTIGSEYRIVSGDVADATDVVYSALGQMFNPGDTSIVEFGEQQELSVETIDYFELLWNMYPKRNGRRVGKSEARAFFKKNFKTQDRIELLKKAIENYGSADTIPKDMVRFMRNDYYLDWLDDAEDDTVGMTYEECVMHCRKKELFPVSKHFEMGPDNLWYPTK